MRWLDRLLARAGPYQPRQIAAIEHTDTHVEIEGKVEALELLYDPIDGTAAVVLEYRAQQRFFGLDDMAAHMAGCQATNFVLRDASGAALIEVARGADIAQLHRHLREKFGLGLEVRIEHVAPGDSIRLRGRVRARADQGSPHRREPWAVIVTLDELEG
jgi:hypothetical protein